MRRKSKWIFIADLVRKEVGDITNDFKGQVQVTKTTDPEELERLRLEKERREKALEAYQKERQKRREKEESAREKFRDAIRQKYGIERRSMDQPAIKPESTSEKSMQQKKPNVEALNKRYQGSLECSEMRMNRTLNAEQIKKKKRDQQCATQ